ncbi:MAG: hypothetical protein KatS3mg055_0025 [Chloroflexus sp.]|nr:MAG: hypothetical protein KatS3mg055_0025 [Chloroflexus sp.]
MPCPYLPCPSCRPGARRNDAVRRPSRASPIAPRRPSRRGDPAGRPYIPYLPQAVPYPNHHHTTACRCASGRRGASPIRSGRPGGSPTMVGARYAVPILPSRCASERRGASPIACVTHRVGLPIVGATRRVAPTYRTPHRPYRVPPITPPRHNGMPCPDLPCPSCRPGARRGNTVRHPSRASPITSG